MSSSYKVSRRIGRGGMAEVYLALREGVGGFEKLVVVKRIFSHFCEDQRFVTMFLDEARLAASISHPNVVEIFDIGEDDDGYFMAMEYLSGETLALVYETLRARQSTIPAPIVARIGADVAAGLHYAHSATNPSGTPLDIVHRDVTPSNIIVCFNGTTKIVDFGIAKAQVRDSQTRSGALKGKMAYLSPEQIEDSTVDHRTDIFQLGICLHEMLTGQRLFDADGDHQKMVAVMERPILPPSEVNPYVPKVFDDVVLRALQRDVRKRTQSADQLRRELEYALKQLGSTVSDHDVSDWMQSTFGERYRERVAMERESVSQMRSGVRPGLAKAANPGNKGSTPSLVTVVGHSGAEGKRRARPKRRKLAPVAVALGTGLGVLIGAVVFVKQRNATGDPEPPAVEVEPLGDVNPAPVTARFTVRFQVEPAEAEIQVDGKVVGKGGLAREFAADGREHSLALSAPGYISREVTFTNTPPFDEPVIRLTRKAKEPESAGESADPVAARSPGGDKSVPSSSKSTTTGVKSPEKEGSKTGDPSSSEAGESWKGSRSDNIDPWER